MTDPAPCPLCEEPAGFHNDRAHSLVREYSLALERQNFQLRQALLVVAAVQALKIAGDAQLAWSTDEDQAFVSAEEANQLDIAYDLAYGDLLAALAHWESS